MPDQVGKPAEATLDDDLDDTDLRAKVSAAWSEFSNALAAELARLGPGTTLNLALDPSAVGMTEVVYEVSVVMEAGQLIGYAISNTQLPAEHRLSRTAVGDLIALGWSPPGVVAGSEERFGLDLPPARSSRLARIVSRTLRDVYGSPHPAFLVYDIRDESGAPVPGPALGAARPMADVPTSGPADLSQLPLAEQVTAVIATMLHTAPENLPVDKDGDIGIRAGSAIVFVRVRDNPPLVDVFSPVLTEVEPTEGLHVRLSELTHRMPIGRLYCTDDTVWASVPVFGRNFQPAHLALAVEVMTGLADELDDRLAGEFGGKRFFTEAAAATGAEPDIDALTEDRSAAGTGMYL